jgi:hypothetical protein
VAHTYRSLPKQAGAVLGPGSPRGTEVAHTYRSFPGQPAVAALARAELAPAGSDTIVTAAKADANSAAFQVVIGLRRRLADVPVSRVMLLVPCAL